MHRDFSQLLHLELLRYLFVCFSGYANGVDLGCLFHACGDVDGISHRRIFHPLSRPDRADDDQAGVDANPHAEFDAPTGAYRLAVGTHAIDDREPGKHGPLRIVLVGNRCAEKGQDAIACQACDRAAIRVDRLVHVLERAVDDLGPLLRIEF